MSGYWGLPNSAFSHGCFTVFSSHQYESITFDKVERFLERENASKGFFGFGERDVLVTDSW